MRFAHLSDFHTFADSPEQGLVREDTPERLDRLVDYLTGITPKLDLIVVTGDLTEGGGASDYARLRRQIGPLDIPVLPIPGNHDERAAMRAAFPDLPYADATFLHYEMTMAGVRFIALDTFSPGEIGGRLCPARLDWLSQRLATPHAGQTYILMHHPPCATATGVLDKATLLEGGAALGQMVAGRGGDLAILCGHLHLPIECVWKGVPVWVATSIAFQFDLSLDAPVQPATVDTPYTFGVHCLDDPDTRIVHRCHVEL